MHYTCVSWFWSWLLQIWKKMSKQLTVCCYFLCWTFPSFIAYLEGNCTFMLMKATYFLGNEIRHLILCWFNDFYGIIPAVFCLSSDVNRQIETTCQPVMSQFFLPFTSDTITDWILYLKQLQLLYCIQQSTLSLIVVPQTVGLINCVFLAVKFNLHLCMDSGIEKLTNRPNMSAVFHIQKLDILACMQISGDYDALKPNILYNHTWFLAWFIHGMPMQNIQSRC